MDTHSSNPPKLRVEVNDLAREYQFLVVEATLQFMVILRRASLYVAGLQLLVRLRRARTASLSPLSPARGYCGTRCSSRWADTKLAEPSMTDVLSLPCFPWRCPGEGLFVEWLPWRWIPSATGVVGRCIRA